MTREDAIKIISQMIKDEEGFLSDNTVEAHKMAIKALEQEPKTGHWITTRTFMHDGEFYCDKCKCDAPNNEKWDYCPNCGAKMVKPQERSGEE